MERKEKKEIDNANAEELYFEIMESILKNYDKGIHGYVVSFMLDFQISCYNN